MSFLPCPLRTLLPPAVPLPKVPTFMGAPGKSDDDPGRGSKIHLGIRPVGPKDLGMITALQLTVVPYGLLPQGDTGFFAERHERCLQAGYATALVGISGRNLMDGAQ